VARHFEITTGATQSCANANDEIFPGERVTSVVEVEMNPSPAALVINGH
jgi:hypothetical protein